MPNPGGLGGVPGISLEALHWILWQRRRDEDSVVITMKDLAEELAVSRQRIGQVITGLEFQGRLFRTRERRIFQIVDPAKFVS